MTFVLFQLIQLRESRRCALTFRMLATLTLVAAMTVTLAACGGGTPTLVQPDSGSEQLVIPAGDLDTVELNLQAGQSVNLSYGAMAPGPNTGRTLVEAFVKLTVVDPLENPIVKVEEMKNHSLEFTAEISGVYKLVFENPYKLPTLDVQADWRIS